ncbi:MAG: cyclic nucleotide-binding domain-containing protein [Pseudomonadota bacterium]
MLDLIPPSWIVGAAGVTFIIGYLIINQVILRWWINIGTLLYIWYYAASGGEGTTTAIITSVLMGSANCLGLAQIYYRNSKYVIPKEHQDIYPIFDTLPPGDFRALMKFADRHVTEANQIITAEGEENDHLYYILSGKLKVSKLKQKFELPAHIFVGEVAYMTGQTASATTELAKGSEVLRWDIAELRKRSAKDDRFRLALDALISSDLARKVTAAVAPKGYKAPAIAAE